MRLARTPLTDPTGQVIELARAAASPRTRAIRSGSPTAPTSSGSDHAAPPPPHSGPGFAYLANPSTEYAPDGSNSVPAGTVTFGAFYAPPAAEVANVDMEIGGW